MKEEGAPVTTRFKIAEELDGNVIRVVSPWLMEKESHSTIDLLEEQTTSKLEGSGLEKETEPVITCGF